MTGLSQKEVVYRRAQGQGNVKDNDSIKSYGQIIRGNVFTFFNFLNLALFALVLFVGSFRNTLFIGNVIINTLIGIIQECRAKRIIEKLAILTQEKATVLREGRYETVPTQDLVLGDVIELRTGNQVPADSKILEGNVEVNEALLTGESDTLPRAIGEELFSGSFITSGLALCEITRVGADSLAGQIVKEARVYKRHHSELRGALDAILKIVSIIIVPLGILLFYKAYVLGGESLSRSVISTVAGVQGMIPEGLYLLTSIALTVGSIFLARRQTLIQELYCIETLARVDTLCLDKTGTITTGEMALDSIVPYEGTYQTPILLSKSGESTEEAILASLYSYTPLEENLSPIQTRPAILEI
ncbi:MAG: HAD-IC family P-type ATPase, partial [Blautia sp.]|nr:HAD-IC family P-type ATPase [Blautia sp.]